jgi:hypothetical protein
MMEDTPADGGLASKEFGGLALNLLDHLDAMVAYWDAVQVCAKGARRSTTATTSIREPAHVERVFEPGL